MRKVIFTRRAYLSMLAEVYERIDTETGGILLGHRDGDKWYVLESVEPGPKSIFTPTYFEYDDAYITYRANKLRRLYKCSIELLGLWHRHPSLMKTFSMTDDGTNKVYTDMLNGAISGIVTLGNGFEITMYYVPSNLQYEVIEWDVDDSQFPVDYLAYYDTEYYRHLINSTVKKPYAAFSGVASDHKPDGGGSTQESNQRASHGSVQRPRQQKKKLFLAFMERVADRITDLVEYLDDAECVDNDREEQEDSDIAFIFDTIESEIAYLQKLEANGDIKSTISARKDNKGKDGLILTIEDMRQDEQFSYETIFFVSNDRVMVKAEDGKVRPYSANYITTFLGG